MTGAAAKRPLEHSVCNGIVCEARTFIYDRWDWLWDWRRQKPMTTMVATEATTARASTADRAHAARSARFAARSRSSSGVYTRSDGERKWLTELGAARAEITLFLEAWSANALPAPVAGTHLRAAVFALDELVGVIDADEVLGRVFATFCVGK